MNKKQEKLLFILSEHGTLTANELAQQLNLSIRTIKYYIKELNDEFDGGIITSSQKGYTVKTPISKLLIQDIDIEDSPKDRQSKILIKILNSSDKFDLFDLSEEMFISYSTLQIELKKIKHQLSKFDLDMQVKNNHIYIISTEKNKRKLISSLLYNQSNIDFMNYATIQSLFPNIDVNYLKTIIISILEENQYFINDYSLINFILHVTIMVDRIKHNNFTNYHGEIPSVSESTYKICKLLSEKIEERFSITFSEFEITELVILLISRANQINYDTTNLVKVQNYIGTEVSTLVALILKKLNQIYFIKIEENSEFILRFSLHIKNLLIRASNNYLSKNPLVESIKIQAPLIYDISVTIASIIQEQTKLTINDDEIAYIAFHLGSLIETQKQLVTTLTAILYCPNYYQTAKTLATKLSEFFGKRLLIKDIVNEEESIPNPLDVDLIITTVPINKKINCPTQTTTLFFNQHDKDKINRSLDSIIKSKQKGEFEEKLRELITPELFKINMKINNRYDAINYMVETLQQNGYVNNDFMHKIMEREKLSSTAFNQFAIPHSLSMEALKTGISILINPKGIEWDSQNVQLVLMLCFSPNQRTLFNEIFEPLTNILIEPVSFARIIKSNNYDEFIINLLSSNSLFN
ncbi:BglG family transcription antiterminator [Streptococcus periodonticum]|uniref:PRD domain-containing protein n=1 Tax=Streptococcus periodonticum TaxID=2490633 RepID=A0A3Q9F4F4_9STRE|nr:PTS sugar transporter subunit IIA [Streptococcus periodonticum]AZQ42340.1 PRD domain-containing protein [Streptococcus periodonticum]